MNNYPSSLVNNSREIVRSYENRLRKNPQDTYAMEFLDSQGYSIDNDIEYGHPNPTDGVAETTEEYHQTNIY